MVAADLVRAVVFVAAPVRAERARDRRRSPSSPASRRASSGRPPTPGCRTSSRRAELPPGERAAPVGREPDRGRSGRSSAARSSPWPGPTSRTASTPLTFVVSALFLLAHPRRASRRRSGEPSRGHWRDLADGFSPRRPRARRSSPCSSRGASSCSRTPASTSPRSSSRRRSSTPATSASACSSPAGAVGLVLGSLGAARRDRAARHPAGLSARRSRSWAPASLAARCRRTSGSRRRSRSCAGIGNGAAVVCNALLVQRGAPDALRGRVFTRAHERQLRACSALGMIAAGPFTNECGRARAWVVAAGLCARRARSPAIAAPSRLGPSATPCRSSCRSRL